MAATVTVKCKCCGDPFIARVADRKRGWARFCSKSCKAIKQEQRTGATAAYRARQARREGGAFSMSPAELAMGGYGDSGPDDPFHEGKL